VVHRFSIVYLRLESRRNISSGGELRAGPLVKKAMSFNEEFGGGGGRWASFRKWNCGETE
jgi:hypothetical protein